MTTFLIAIAAIVALNISVSVPCLLLCKALGHGPGRDPYPDKKTVVGWCTFIILVITAIGGFLCFAFPISS